MCFSTFALAGSGGEMWSEKTTVCRIFSCQRCVKLSAVSHPLAAAGRSDVALSRFVVTASFPILVVHAPGQLSRPVRVPELSILRTPLARCKRERRKLFEPPDERALPRCQPAFALCATAGRPSLMLPPIALPPIAVNRSLLRVSSGERRLENTGLEPVTSWLQTRRSPS